MKRGLNILLASIVMLLLGQDIAAQYYRNQGYWKKDRFSIIGGVGASNFLGELGGRDQIGSDFIWDLETKQFKPALTLGLRYVTSSNTAVRAQFSFAQIGGDDALTQEPFRYNRNLHFQSNLYEVAGLFEYVFYRVRPGHKYNLTGVKGQKPKAASLYAFGGIAGIHFNPKAKLDNEWYELQPLGTEGQNIKGEGPYSLYSIALPFGIGYRWRIAKDALMIGVEIGHRITFTDYMDDVSTVYFDQNQLGDQEGFDAEQNLLALYFGDPSRGYYLGENGEQINLNSTFTGAQRGDPDDNDAYLFAQATLQYTIGKKPYRRKKFSTKKGKRIVF
jgi:hypothetical protein